MSVMLVDGEESAGDDDGSLLQIYVHIYLRKFCSEGGIQLEDL